VRDNLVMTNFDLHFHSTASDGAADLSALRAALAARPDLEACALADHDTIATSVELATFEPRAIVAVELTVAHKQSAPHLLGYGVDPDNSELLAYLSTRQIERRARLEAWSARFAELGLLFAPDPATATSESFGKPHIVAELRRHPSNTALLPPAPPDESISDPIYSTYLKIGGLADISKLVPSTLISLIEGIDLVHQAGGLAVLAHPQVSFYELGQKRTTADWHAGAAKADGWLREFAAAGLDGVEVFNHRQGAEFRETLISIADELGLLVSAGTDDHTPTGEHIGEAFADESGPQEEPRATRWLAEFQAALDRSANR
jgi:predicted metal-dependent phosphoesterase TrpH